MTQTQPCPNDEDAVRPADPLFHIAATFLANMFLAAGCTDAAIAHRAALDSLGSYRARNHADLLVVAQTISLAFNALTASGLAMAEGVPLPVADRLLGRVVSLTLAGQRMQRSRDRIHADIKAREKAIAGAKDAALAREARASETASVAAPRVAAPREAAPRVAAPRVAAAAAPEPAVEADAPAPRQLARPAPPGPRPAAAEGTAAKGAAAEQADQAKRRYLGKVLNQVAERFLAEVPGLPPSARQEHSLRAELASGVARDLLGGKPWPVPGYLRPGAPAPAP